MEFDISDKKQFRKMLGMTQKEMAFLLECPREMIAMLENSTRHYTENGHRYHVIAAALTNCGYNPGKSEFLCKLEPGEHKKLSIGTNHKRSQLRKLREKLSEMENDATNVNEMRYRLSFLPAQVNDMAKAASMGVERLEQWIDLAISMQEKMMYDCSLYKQTELKMKIAAMEAEIAVAEKILAENG